MNVTGRPVWLLLGLGVLLVLPAGALAEGPGSGDEVRSRQHSPAMLRRYWRYSRAKRAQERRIRELERRIKTLRAALPQLQSEGMKEADRLRSAQSYLQSRKSRVQANWSRVVRLRGHSPAPQPSATYGTFGILQLWSADTNNWRKSSTRRDNADGDDFYIYASVGIPRLLVKNDSYAVDWEIRGHDFTGVERTLYRHSNYSWSKEFNTFKWTRFKFRRRFMGLGLTPGYYEVKATMKTKRKRYLKRSFLSVVKVSQVSPRISAPPSSSWRSVDVKKVHITNFDVRSRGAQSGRINPKAALFRGSYQVDAAFVGPDKHLLVGAQVYAANASGRLTFAKKAVRTAFRFRLPLKRRLGRFGSKELSSIKDLQKGLTAGNYVLRVWILVSAGTRNYWSYKDRRFTVGTPPAAPPARKGGK